MGHRIVHDSGCPRRCHGEILTTVLTHRVFVGLGSNVGDRLQYIVSAISWLKEQPQIVFVRVTEIVETDPWGNTHQPAFLNAVAEIRTDLAPESLLKELKQAERFIGRSEPVIRWGPREIDLDILLFDDRVLQVSDLIIPHPALTERDFVIRHLIELDATLRDPRSGRSLSEFLKNIE